MERPWENRLPLLLQPVRVTEARTQSQNLFADFGLIGRESEIHHTA